MLKYVESSETTTVARPAQVNLFGKLAPQARCRGHQEEHLCWMASKIVNNPERGTFQGKCSSLTCTTDAEPRRERLADSVGSWTVKLSLCYFWTLTLADSGWVGCSTCESRDVASIAWNRFLAAVKKHRPDVDFIRFVEFTQAGVAHVHFVTNAWLPHEWVSAEWKRASGGSYIAWVDRIYSEKEAANYVSKYLTLTSKTQGKKGLYPKGCRRYNTSRSIRLLPKSDDLWGIWQKWHVRKILSTHHLANLYYAFERYSAVRAWTQPRIDWWEFEPPDEELDLKHWCVYHQDVDQLGEGYATSRIGRSFDFATDSDGTEDGSGQTT